MLTVLFKLHRVCCILHQNILFKNKELCSKNTQKPSKQILKINRYYPTGSLVPALPSCDLRFYYDFYPELPTKAKYPKTDYKSGWAELRPLEATH